MLGGEGTIKKERRPDTHAERFAIRYNYRVMVVAIHPIGESP